MDLSVLHIYYELYPVSFQIKSNIIFQIECILERNTELRKYI